MHHNVSLMQWPVSKMVPTRPNLVVSAETAAKGVSAGSGASMTDGWREWRMRGTGLVPLKVVRLVFAMVSLGSNQLWTDLEVLMMCLTKEFRMRGRCWGLCGGFMRNG
jgi:hypothetical protein